MTAKSHRPVVLIVRDGWGTNPDPAQNEFNAIFLAKRPVDDRLMRDHPHTLIKTCGLDVGLPPDTMGNSEVGHQNIGAGRVADQEIVRINKAIDSGEFDRNRVLLEAIEFARRRQGALHLMGLASDAGVHSMISHLVACLEFSKRKGFNRIFIHVFTDGRDTPPTSGASFIRQIEKECARIGAGRIATVCGRYYSMDRDKRWERVQQAYDCLVAGKGRAARSAEEAVQTYYQAPSLPTRCGDEFVIPSNVVDAAGQPVATVKDGDSAIFFNFRGDRPREITRAFVEPDFKGFPRNRKLDLYFATMTEYEAGLPVHPVFPKPKKMKAILGMHVAALGLKQFRCAETEKYPHVTFFFNDYRDEPFEGENRVIIPSPKVPTYDLQPEMSAAEVCEETVHRIQSGKYDLVVVNFANPDMVGHTGSLRAAIRAVETVDACVGKILEAVRATGGAAIVTADHGNCEQMWDPVHECPHTSHTLNDVALIVADEALKGVSLRSGGRLADIAPTLLEMMGLKVPAEMTGESLFLTR